MTSLGGATTTSLGGAGGTTAEVAGRLLTSHSWRLTHTSSIASAGVRGDERGVSGTEHELLLCGFGGRGSMGMTVRGKRGEEERRGGGGGGLSRASRSSPISGNFRKVQGTIWGEGA